jgi:hypothetical protein
MTTLEKNEYYDPEPKPCCTDLRCKSMYYRDDERPGMLHWSNSMGYYCVKTADAVGPDGESALHPDCQPGRSCYKGSPVDTET